MGSPKLPSYYGLSACYGSLVTSVIPRGPAYKADLEAGDVILTLNGVRVMVDGGAQERGGPKRGGRPCES